MLHSKKWEYSKLPEDNLKVFRSQAFVIEYCKLPILKECDNIYVHNIKAYGFHFGNCTPIVQYRDFTCYDNTEFPNTDKEENEYKQDEYVTPVVIYYSNYGGGVIKKARIPKLYWDICTDIIMAITIRDLQTHSKVFPIHVNYNDYNQFVTQVIDDVETIFLDRIPKQLKITLTQDEYGKVFDNFGNDYLKSITVDED